MLLKRIVFSILCCSFQLSHAAELFEPFQSVRQLGMGGVYTFNENDASSFLQNPAYSCYLEGLNWSVFDLNGALGNIQDYTDLVDEGGGSMPSPDSLEGLSPFYGKNIWLNIYGHSSFTLPCFGFAGYYGAVANFYLHNPAFPHLKTFYLTDYGVNIGGAIPISSVLSVGMAVKRVTRKGGPYTFGPSTLVDLSGDNAVQDLVSSIENEGVGYGFDMGLVSRFSILPFNPTVSLAWKDVGSTAFNKTKGTDAPERQKDNLVLGMTFDGSIPLLGISGGVEYRHITDLGEQLGKKLHAGLEMNLLFFDARAGFYQGYTTYGVGIDLWILQIDAAWYTVEKGAYPGQTPDERGRIGLTMDLEFDPNFNLVDAGGRKRRLKQRR